MKQCVQFPDESFLIVRPSLVAICLNNRPAAKLLGVLLYRYNIVLEHKDDAENQNAAKKANGETPDQDTSFRIFRSQAQLVEDMCGEIVEKTLHDTAAPMLQLLNFLEVEERPGCNCYEVNLDLVKTALEIYAQRPNQLEKFLIAQMQLEKFLIEPEQLEKTLINKKNFQLLLEKVLIANRKNSNCRRGRKVNGEARSGGKKQSPKNLLEKKKKTSEEESDPAPESQPSESGSVEPTRPHSLSGNSQDEKGHDNDTHHPASSEHSAGSERAGGAQSTQRGQGYEQPAGSVATGTLTATVPTGKTTATAQLSTCAPAYPQRGAKVAPRPSAFVAAPLFGAQKPARPQLTEMGKNVLEWYQIIQACKVRKTDANINACNGLGEEDGMSFDNLKKAIEHWEAHSYVKERQIPIDLQKLEDPKGAFTFAKAMLVIRPKPKHGNSTQPTTNKPTVSGLKRWTPPGATPARA